MLNDHKLKKRAKTSHTCAEKIEPNVIYFFNIISKLSYFIIIHSIFNLSNR